MPKLSTFVSIFIYKYNTSAENSDTFLEIKCVIIENFSRPYQQWDRDYLFDFDTDILQKLTQSWGHELSRTRLLWKGKWSIGLFCPKTLLWVSRGGLKKNLTIKDVQRKKNSHLKTHSLIHTGETAKVPRVQFFMQPGFSPLLNYMTRINALVCHYCKSLPFIYFLTFEKGRLPYIHPVGRSVGWRHH